MKIEINNTKAGAPATKPEATDGDRELARQCTRIVLEHAESGWDMITPMIASHVASRLAPVEAERDALRATVAKLEEFQEINDSEFTAEVSARKQAESERDALKRLLTDSVCRIQETDGESLLVKRIMEAL